MVPETEGVTLLDGVTEPVAVVVTLAELEILVDCDREPVADSVAVSVDVKE